MFTEAGFIQFLVYAVFFLGITGFSFILYGVLLKFSRNLGIRQEKDVVRWASTAKPALGGIIFYIVFLIAGACYTMFFDGSDRVSDLQSIGSLAAISLAFMMGLADDAYNTRPFLKFVLPGTAIMRD